MRERWYTAAELLAEANAAGTPASGRLITDWLEQGLLDHPRRRGLGRGKGVVGAWPEDQRELFLVLLSHRSRGVKRLVALCNVPVTVWLDSEGLDRDYVPLRQVRRCLATWASYRTGSARAARRAAEQLITQWGAQPVSRRARRSLIDAVSRATGGAKLDRGALLDAARHAFASERLAELWTATVEARFAAIEQLDEIDDQTFEAARLEVNRSAAAYGQRQLGATTGDARRQRATEVVNELANNACVSLVTALGFELTRRHGQTIPGKSAPRPLQRPGATARGGHTPHADQDATARPPAGRGSPEKASAS